MYNLWHEYPYEIQIHILSFLFHDRNGLLVQVCSAWKQIVDRFYLHHIPFYFTLERIIFESESLIKLYPHIPTPKTFKKHNLKFIHHFPINTKLLFYLIRHNDLPNIKHIFATKRFVHPVVHDSKSFDQWFLAPLVAMVSSSLDTFIWFLDNIHIFVPERININFTDMEKVSKFMWLFLNFRFHPRSKIESIVGVIEYFQEEPFQVINEILPRFKKRCLFHPNFSNPNEVNNIRKLFHFGFTAGNFSSWNLAEKFIKDIDNFQQNFSSFITLRDLFPSMDDFLKKIKEFAWKSFVCTSDQRYKIAFDSIICEFNPKLYLFNEPVKTPSDQLLQELKILSEKHHKRIEDIFLYFIELPLKYTPVETFEYHMQQMLKFKRMGNYFIREDKLNYKVLYWLIQKGEVDVSFLTPKSFPLLSKVRKTQLFNA